jgi:hypothetical protein
MKPYSFDFFSLAANIHKNKMVIVCPASLSAWSESTHLPPTAPGDFFASHIFVAEKNQLRLWVYEEHGPGKCWCVGLGLLLFVRLCKQKGVFFLFEHSVAPQVS